MITMPHLAFIEGLREQGLVPLQDPGGVRELVQLLDVVVVDIGPGGESC